MNKLFSRWTMSAALALAVSAGVASLLPSNHVRADDAAGPVAVAPAAAPVTGAPLAAVDQMKSDAFKALRGGKFDVGNDLLARAASMSGDPSLVRMAGWTQQFESQREKFTAERRKGYDKAVGDVKLLQEKHPDYAIDAAARAYLLADDKQAFSDEPWVRQVIADSIHHADGYEATEQWLKALRIYSDLSAVEPFKPIWKDRLKAATRRVRLLGLYTPDAIKAVQEAESKERDEVDKLIHSETVDMGPPPKQPVTSGTTRPAGDSGTVLSLSLTTKPDVAGSAATKPADGVADTIHTDWHDTLRGINMDMLRDALVDAKTNYFREVSYRKLTIGGLKGLEAIVTTHGLEKAFPGLGEDAKRDALKAQIDDDLNEADKATPATEQGVLVRALANIESINRQSVQLPEEVIVSEFADGAFAELDPFTSMIWPTDFEEFNKTTQGEFTGVGIQIQNDDEGNIKVVSPLEDSPAYRAGVKAGDTITKINGKLAKGVTLNQAVHTITGAPNTTVTLTIRSPDASVKDLVLRRELIKVASVKGWQHLPGGGWNYLVDPDNKIAYLRITNFTKTTGDELEKATDDLKQLGAKAVILDLRYNPGGLLTAATEVSDKFLKDGVIVKTHPDRDTPNQPTEADARDDGNECDLPLVVLVNQYSASASEIVSGALHDDHRALIVGERTFGKGSVQMLFPLSGRTAYLKLTTSHYYLPSGRCLHREENSTEWGVDPDVKIEMTPEQMRAAIDARQDLDVLRDSPAPAGGEQKTLNAVAPTVGQAVESAGGNAGNTGGVAGNATAATTQPEKKDLLSSDPQMSAALLVLRLQLAGAQM